MPDKNHIRLDEVSETNVPTAPVVNSWCTTTLAVKAITGAVVVISVVLAVTLGLLISAMVRINQLEATTRVQDKTRCPSNQSLVRTEPSSTPTVVFAAKSADDLDVVDGKLMKFTTVVTNIGGGYDSDTGYFTAPHSGTYLFQTSVCARKEKWVFVHIMAGSESVVTTGVYDIEAHGSCTSATGIVVLAREDKAWVQGAWNESAALYVDGRYSLPTFTGVLLHMGTS